jgi:hypothetical protein
MKPPIKLPPIAQAAADELTAQLLPELRAILGDCLLITPNRAAGLLEMNTAACKKMLDDHGLLVDLGPRFIRVRLSAINQLIESRSGRRPRAAYGSKSSKKGKSE